MILQCVLFKQLWYFKVHKSVRIFIPRKIGLFCRFCWNDSACSPFFTTTTCLFSQTSPLHIPCCCLEVLSTRDNFCLFLRHKFEEVSTQMFCSSVDTLTQIRNCGSPNNLSKCTKSTFTLSTITSIDWNLYLS